MPVVIILKALLTTLLILLLMTSLVELADDTLYRSEKIILPEIYMPKEHRLEQTIVELPEKLNAPQKPPQIDIEQQPPQFKDTTPTNTNMNLQGFNINMDLNIGGDVINSSGDYLPIVKIAPRYPRNALRQKIEGYVIVEYTVTSEGSVEDVRVIEEQPEKIFSKVAMQSAQKYKYQPRIINGKAVAVEGVRTKITFRLDQ